MPREYRLDPYGDVARAASRFGGNDMARFGLSGNGWSVTPVWSMKSPGFRFRSSFAEGGEVEAEKPLMDMAETYGVAEPVKYQPGFAVDGSEPEAMPMMGYDPTVLRTLSDQPMPVMATNMAAAPQGMFGMGLRPRTQPMMQAMAGARPMMGALSGMFPQRPSMDQLAAIRQMMQQRRAMMGQPNSRSPFGVR
jgi:hypothetical protein